MSSAGSGRMEEANEAGCPFVLAGCGASDHPSLSEASISGNHCAPPPLPLMPEAVSHRHISAKWSLCTILTGPISISTGHVGQSRKNILFPLPSHTEAWRKLTGRMKLNEHWR